jgi:hypothetical protein
MIQRGDSAGLPVKSFGELLLADLDGHDPVEPGVARLIDFAHSSGADAPDDFVWAEAIAGSEPHSVFE